MSAWFAWLPALDGHNDGPLPVERWPGAGWLEPDPRVGGMSWPHLDGPARLSAFRRNDERTEDDH